MILAPFKWIVALFFNASLAFFGDPGWAVVGMSVLLSLLLTPLYVWIERRKTSDRARYAPMQAEIDKIDAVYAGRERYYYTREIQRRHRYRPWVALVPTLGLLVQIPFLLAAYHYLSELPVFAGASFGYIRDLAKPDTVAVVAGMPVNLLAILMTVINLVSGWRYAESGKPKDRLQYAAVAFVFLFLLYNCAASVVLYWTLSNALSLVRSEIFFRKRGVAAVAAASDSAATTRMLAAVHFASLAVAVYCFAVGFFPAAGCRVWETLVMDMDVCGAILLIAGWAAALAAGVRDVRFRPFDGVLGWLFTVVEVVAIAAAVVLSRRTVHLAGCVVVVGLVVGFRVEARLWNVLFPARRTGARTGGLWAGAAAVLYGAAVVLLWHPLSVRALSPMSFDVSALGIVLGGSVWTLAVTGLYLLLGRIAFRRFATSAFVGVPVFLAIVLFAYTFLISCDAGTLQGAQLVGADRLVRTTPFYLAEAAGLVAAALLAADLVRRVPAGRLAAVFLLAHAAAAGQSLWRMSRAAASADSTRAADVRVAEDGVALSRTAKNVVVFMLDMVQGASFGAVRADPALSAGLGGFVWYSNSVSVANMTCPSLPSVYAGRAGYPDVLNADASRNLNEKASGLMRDLRSTFAAKGYDFRHYNCNAAVFRNELTQVSPLFDRAFLSRVTGLRDCHASGGDAGVLRCNALMQACPTFLKPFVYNGGRWRFGAATEDAYRSFSQDHMFYEALPRLTRLSDGARGAFNFFHVEVTHNPWGVPTDDGRFVQTDNVGELKWIMSRLVRYFDWMRREGVYDNTRIVLVSDHGLVNMSRDEFRPERDPMRHRELWKGLTADLPPHYMLEEQRIQMLNCLLAVKDFSDRRPLRTDGRLMSNGDVRSLLESESFERAAAALPPYRETFVAVPPASDGEYQDRNRIDILARFRVRTNVYDLVNWERVK